MLFGWLCKNLCPGSRLLQDTTYLKCMYENAALSKPQSESLGELTHQFPPYAISATLGSPSPFLLYLQLFQHHFNGPSASSQLLSLQDSVFTHSPKWWPFRPQLLKVLLRSESLTGLSLSDFPLHICQALHNVTEIPTRTFTFCTFLRRWSVNGLWGPFRLRLSSNLFCFALQESGRL